MKMSAKCKYLLFGLFTITVLGVGYNLYCQNYKETQVTLQKQLDRAAEILEDSDHSEEDHAELESIMGNLPIVNDIQLDGDHSIHTDYAKNLVDKVLDESTLSCGGIEYELMLTNEVEDTIELFYRTNAPTDKVSDFKVEQYIIYLIMNQVEAGNFKQKGNDRLLRIHFYHSEDENFIPDVSDMTTDIILLSEAESWTDYRHVFYRNPDHIEVEVTDVEEDTIKINRFE